MSRDADPVHAQGHGLPAVTNDVSKGADGLHWGYGINRLPAIFDEVSDRPNVLPADKHKLPGNGDGLFSGRSRGNSLPAESDAVSDGSDYLPCGWRGAADSLSTGHDSMPDAPDPLPGGRYEMPGRAHAVPDGANRLSDSADDLPAVGDRLCEPRNDLPNDRRHDVCSADESRGDRCCEVERTVA